MTSEIKSPQDSRAKRPPTDLVRRVRVALGMTQEEFAREMGCTVGSVSKMEREQRLPGGVGTRATFKALLQQSGVDSSA